MSTNNHHNRGRLTVDTNGKWQLYTNTIPPGSVPIGTVAFYDFDPGALVVFPEPSQEYWQVNAGMMTPLPQRKVKAAIAEMSNKSLEKSGVDKLLTLAGGITALLNKAEQFDVPQSVVMHWIFDDRVPLLMIPRILKVFPQLKPEDLIDPAILNKQKR